MVVPGTISCELKMGDFNLGENDDNALILNGQDKDHCIVLVLMELLPFETLREGDVPVSDRRDPYSDPGCSLLLLEIA